MVGLFSAYNNNMDKKEAQVDRELRDEDDERNNLLHHHHDDDDDDDDDDDYDEDEDEGDGDDEDGEFKPIEHPLEPPEDDEPAKCPTVPDLSFIYDEADWKESFTEKPQKRAESFVGNEVAAVDPRKHHKIAQDSANPFQVKGPQYNIFEVFQQCKEFGFS